MAGERVFNGAKNQRKRRAQFMADVAEEAVLRGQLGPGFRRACVRLHRPGRWWRSRGRRRSADTRSRKPL